MEETISQITARVDELEEMTHCALGMVIAIFVALFAVGFFYVGAWFATHAKGKE